MTLSLTSRTSFARSVITFGGMKSITIHDYRESQSEESPVHLVWVYDDKTDGTV